MKRNGSAFDIRWLCSKTNKCPAKPQPTWHSNINLLIPRLDPTSRASSHLPSRVTLKYGLASRNHQLSRPNGVISGSPAARSSVRIKIHRSRQRGVTSFQIVLTTRLPRPPRETKPSTSSHSLISSRLQRSRSRWLISWRPCPKPTSKRGGYATRAVLQENRPRCTTSSPRGRRRKGCLSDPTRGRTLTVPCCEMQSAPKLVTKDQAEIADPCSCRRKIDFVFIPSQSASLGRPGLVKPSPFLTRLCHCYLLTGNTQVEIADHADVGWHIPSPPSSKLALPKNVQSHQNVHPSSSPEPRPYLSFPRRYLR